MKRVIMAADGLTSRERAKIAKTTNNQRELLRLANDRSTAVRREVAKRIDLKYLEMLADDKDEDVRNTVAERTDDENILAKLSDDENWDVRRTVARHTHDENILAKLADDEEWAVRDIVAERTNDENTLAKLATDEVTAVRESVARRSNPVNELAKPRNRKPPKNDWSIQIYELENYASIEPEIDAVIDRIMGKVAASDPYGREFSYEVNANSYDDEGKFIVSATDSAGETTEASIDLQQFLAVITSSQKKSDCIKKGVQLVKRLTA